MVSVASQLSVASGAVQIGLAPQLPEAELIVSLGGQPFGNTGSMVSLTVIVKVHCPLLFSSSTAEAVTVVIPVNKEPEVCV